MECKIRLEAAGVRLRGGVRREAGGDRATAAK
jgi:hypothetical protein